MYQLRIWRLALAACVSVFAACSVMADEEKPKDEELARRVVTESAGVQPGDVVAIAGGKHTVQLMESIAIEVQKAGGLPVMLLSSDRVERSRWVDMPEEYLDQTPEFLVAWLKEIDVWIGLPDEEDPQAIRAGVPESRLARAAKADAAVDEAFRKHMGSAVWIGYPTHQEADQNGLDVAQYEAMYWRALAADYSAISRVGHKIKDMLRSAKNVTVSSPAGTKITVALADRPIMVNDGVVTREERREEWFINRVAGLPGGSVVFAPVETTVQGKVVVPGLKYRDAVLRGVEFEFAAGKTRGLRAAEGEAVLKEVLSEYQGIDRLGVISIGLNPHFRVVEENGAEFRPFDGAGVVWLLLGNNAFLGGDNQEVGGFGFPITNATVAIDGQVVVRDGQLVP